MAEFRGLAAGRLPRLIIQRPFFHYFPMTMGNRTTGQWPGESVSNSGCEFGGRRLSAIRNAAANGADPRRLRPFDRCYESAVGLLSGAE